MTLIIEGSICPKIKLETEDGIISLENFKGKKVLLYFYPKDNTPGCTQEACDFRDSFEIIKARGVVVIGISKDSIESHKKFKTKFSLPFILASDPNGKACQDFGVWVEKNMYGKKSFGIERSTFLINEEGKIQKIWRKVKAKGHVQEVLSALKS